MVFRCCVLLGDECQIEYPGNQLIITFKASHGELSFFGPFTPISKSTMQMQCHQTPGLLSTTYPAVAC